jgi:hypothetical protein
MKKLFVLLLIGGAFVAFTSCKKTCNCDTYLNGVVISTTPDFELPSGYGKCSDYDLTSDPLGLGISGMKCK